jgi:hypothetical protein
MKKINNLAIVFLVLLSACNNKQKDDEQNNVETTSEVIEEVVLSKADEVINATIKAHGGELYKTANFSFVFRSKQYHFENNNENYKYTVEFKNKDTIVKDIVTNGKFERYKNEVLQNTNEKDVKKYTEALNSVIYFATLPYKLNDASVNKKYIEETTIRNQEYHVVEVTFNQEGGGEDFDDEFHYWINKKTNKIDYLAYNYKVNDGGVRFREAYNTRVVDGVTFQDYINYEAPINTALKDLPKLLEAKKLKEVSRIETEHVINKTK